MSLRAKVEAHAAACREAVAEGRERPRWVGGSLAMADLSGADLSGVDLTGTDLSGVDLVGADLTGADLTRANLSGADLSGAKLSGADLTKANLFRAKLSGADLTKADLTRANLSGADLSGADLTGARLAEGVARGRAIGGRACGYVWWAVALEGGDILLRYGCVCRPLRWWLDQGPELSQRHDHPPEHWAEGPAVAIAAAQALASAG